MNLKIEYSSKFLRQAKKLGKRHRSLKNDLRALVEKLIEDPTLGTLIAPATRKVRVVITSKGRGKSGGGRVITFYEEQSSITDGLKILLLVSVYDKSEKDSISIKDIQQIIAETKPFEEE
jgi:mRNA-degrading endonuclease RelE of RelBE toxin-antitoxin system